jgi:V/A-type H+/Na+-transporting ATPase subunit B
MVRARGVTSRLAVGPSMLGRTFDGRRQPADGSPPLIPHELRDLDGAPLNPVARSHPSEFVETGISAVDGLITLVREQKLPIFSGYGLPAAELAARIATSARVPGETGEDDLVVVAALGVTRREAEFYRAAFAGSSRQHRMVAFLNLAKDPAIKRMQAPRLALTAAEYLAWDAGLQVLVVMTDMTNYCEALREVSAARQELPGTPGLSQRHIQRPGVAVRARGPDPRQARLHHPADRAHHARRRHQPPIPDLAGYITEGQIVLSRDLDRAGIFLPIDVLPSLSRLPGSARAAPATTTATSPTSSTPATPGDGRSATWPPSSAPPRSARTTAATSPSPTTSSSGSCTKASKGGTSRQHSTSHATCSGGSPATS